MIILFCDNLLKAFPSNGVQRYEKKEKRRVKMEKNNTKPSVLHILKLFLQILKVEAEEGDPAINSTWHDGQQTLYMEFLFSLAKMPHLQQRLIFKRLRVALWWQVWQQTSKN